MIRALLIGSILSLTGAASAQPTATKISAPAPDKIVVTGKSKRVCQRNIETGSLMPARVCRTQEEWDELQRGAMATLERIRSNRGVAEKDTNGN